MRLRFTKFTLLILTICLGLLGYPLMAYPGEALPKGTSLIFKPDGTKHCEAHTGVELDSMETRLTTVDITIIAKDKGYDGHEGIAICGAPTGQINIYEITSSDLPAAIKLGFEQLPKNWVR